MYYQFLVTLTRLTNYTSLLCEKDVTLLNDIRDVVLYVRSNANVIFCHVNRLKYNLRYYSHKQQKKKKTQPMGNWSKFNLWVIIQCELRCIYNTIFHKCTTFHYCACSAPTMYKTLMLQLWTLNVEKLWKYSIRFTIAHKVVQYSNVL